MNFMERVNCWMFLESYDLSLCSKFFKQNLLLDTDSQWEFDFRCGKHFETKKKKKKNTDALNFLRVWFYQLVLCKVSVRVLERDK